MNKPCEKCGHNRWRTVIKGKSWRCRKCGCIREVATNGNRMSSYPGPI